MLWLIFLISPRHVIITCAVCPLDFKQPSEVIKACRNVAAPSPLCCSSLNAYIAGIQKQMLITNKQAIICATVFGSMLRKGGVITNVFKLCDVDLKDFSIQGTFSACSFFSMFHSHPACLSWCFTFLFSVVIGAAYGQQGVFCLPISSYKL